MPSPEILGGETLAAQLVQEVVDVAEAHGTHLAGVALVLEQFLPRQVQAAPHDLEHPRAVLQMLAHFAPRAMPGSLSLE